MELFSFLEKKRLKILFQMFFLKIRPMLTSKFKKIFKNAGIQFGEMYAAE